LLPLTLAVPKPLLPTAGLPFLTHLLSRIAEAGIEHVILGTAYKAETFEAEFGDGATLGLQMEYVTEERPLGTGGGIANVASTLRGDTVMVFNGDVLSGVDLTAMLTAHYERDADVTLYLVRVADPRAFGSVPTDADGNVLAFLEKTDDPPTDQINAGCYIFKREILDRIPRGRAVSVEREVFPALLADGAKVCGFVDSGYWRDMGTPEDFVRGSADLVRGIAPSPAVVGSNGEALLLADAQVAADALIDGGSTIGARSIVGAGAIVTGSVVMDDVVLGDGVRIINSIVGRGTRIGARTHLHETVVGDHVDIGSDNEFISGARIWPETHIPAGAIRFSAEA
jgi:mannose-1-phosphate guanylyltransferase